MQRLLLLLIAATLMAACSSSEVTLSPEEQALLEELNFDHDLMLRIKALGVSIERLTNVTYGFGPAAYDAVVLITNRKDGRIVLSEVRTILQGSPYSAFLNSVLEDRVAILKFVDQYGYLDVVQTDGINYGLDHADVVAQYRLWDERYGLSLIGASYDWLEAEFQTPPSDWLAFAHEVYEFSPDVVEQGTGDIKTLAEEMRKSNTVFLWWD